MKYVESNGRGQRGLRKAKQFLCIGTSLVKETCLLSTEKIKVEIAFKVYPVEMRQQYLRWLIGTT